MITIKYFITTLALLPAVVTSLAQRSNNSKNNQKITTSKQIGTQSQHLIYKGQLVEVYVEKAIFHSSAKRNFLLKFTVKNTSNKTVGIDISDYWKVFYPNQWGFYKKAFRDCINEIQIIPDKIFDTSKILKKFKDNFLTIINPNQRLEYYRDWNGSGEKVEMKNENKYLIISIGGQLLVTDGMYLENLTLTEEAERVMVLFYPIRHKATPKNGLIID